MFSAPKAGTIASGVILLVQTSLGTGLFTMHHLFAAIGIFPAIAVICLSALFFNFCASSLAAVLKDHFKQEISYANLVKRILGNKISFLFNVNFLFYTFMSIACRVVVFVQIIFLNVELPLNESNSTNATELFDAYRLVNFIIVFGILVIIFSIKKIDYFRKLCYFSSMIILYLIIVLLIQTPKYMRQVANNERSYDSVIWEPSGLMVNYGLVVFSFNCFTTLFNIFQEFSSPKYSTLRNTSMWSFYSLFTILTILGVCSYLSLGADKAKSFDIILFRDRIGSTDFLMIVGRYGYMICLLLGCGLNMVPLRCLTKRVFGLSDNNRSNYAITIFYSFLMALVSVVFIKARSYMRVAGGFSGAMIVIVFPFLLGLEKGIFKSNKVKVFIKVVTLLFFIISCGSIYFAVKG